MKKEGEDLRLAPFTRIVKLRGYTWDELAKACKVAPQNLSNWRRRDDALVSQIVNALEVIGVGLDIAIDIPGKSSDTSWQIKGEISTRRDKDADSIVDMRAEGGFLSGLATFIISTQLSFSEFCRKTGLNYSLLLKWLKDDDIKVSKYYKIADVFEAKVVWSIYDIVKDESKDITV